MAVLLRPVEVRSLTAVSGHMTAVRTAVRQSTVCSTVTAVAAKPRVPCVVRTTVSFTIRPHVRSCALTQVPLLLPSPLSPPLLLSRHSTTTPTCPRGRLIRCLLRCSVLPSGTVLRPFRTGSHLRLRGVGLVSLLVVTCSSSSRQLQQQAQGLLSFLRSSHLQGASGSSLTCAVPSRGELWGSPLKPQSLV